MTLLEYQNFHILSLILTAYYIDLKWVYLKSNLTSNHIKKGGGEKGEVTSSHGHLHVCSSLRTLIHA